MSTKYKLTPSGMIVSTAVVETPYGMNATVGARWEPGPWPPSFKFVPPQVGATAFPTAEDDSEVMPASNGTGMYWNPSLGIRLWNRGFNSWGSIVASVEIAPPGADLNDFIVDGIYRFQWGTGSYYNTPPGYDFFHAALEVFTMYGYVMQRVFLPYSPNRIFQRSYRAMPEGASEGAVYEWSEWAVFGGALPDAGGQDISTYIRTGQYIFTETAPSAGFPNPQDTPFDPRHSVLEVWDVGGNGIDATGRGFILQRMTSVYDWQHGRFYIRTYSDEYTGVFHWNVWQEYAPDKAVPTYPNTTV
jgi:hypothetical protein